jgi:hypothetical protein
MRETRSSGSVEGLVINHDSYSDSDLSVERSMIAQGRVDSEGFDLTSKDVHRLWLAVPK